jgi:excisionase family DNA binding protein
MTTQHLSADAAPPLAVQPAAMLLTVEQAAELLSLSRTTLYTLMDAGELKYKRIGRARRIPRAELERFAASELTGGWAIQPNCVVSCPSQVNEINGVANTYSQRTANGNSR